MLNTLAGRIRNGPTCNVSGEVKTKIITFENISKKLRANTKPCELEQFSKYCAFVLQDDVMHETLTPKGIYLILFRIVNLNFPELIRFSANLRLDCSTQEKEDRIMKVIHLLQLDDCCNTWVNDYFYEKKWNF